MARNGSGTYSLPAGNPVVTGTVISSTTQNNTMTDVATALTQSLAYDGQTVPVANLPMGTYRHTGVGNAVNRTDYAAAGQLQDGGLMWAGTAGGTANALTLTLTPSIPAYAAGQRFLFKSGASGNSGATTVAISGLATIAVQSNGSACIGGEIVASKWYEIVLDTTSTCQINRISGVSAFMQTLLDDADASTARTTLGVSGPAFSAYAGAATTIASSTFTKILFNTEEYDTNNNFASSTFTPTVAGYYEVNASFTLNGGGINNTQVIITLYKNGVEFKRCQDLISSNTTQISASALIYCNGSTDYIDVYGYIPGVSKDTVTGASLTWFNGAMVRAA